jgi:transketolase
MEGVSEQHVIGFAAGLAKQGFIPFVNTIATFFARRAYEQIAIDLALHQSHVILLATGGGMVYAPLGPTHTAIEDISIISAIPGMKVACPADPLEMKEIIRTSTNLSRPWYVRIGKGGENTLTDQCSDRAGNVKFFGKRESPIILVTTGILLHVAMEFTSRNTKYTNLTRIIHAPIIDELVSEVIMDQIKRAKRVVVLEEHIPIGGLFTRLLHEAHRHGIDSQKLRQISLPHQFSHHYGSQQDHFEHNKLNVSGILECLQNLKL